MHIEHSVIIRPTHSPRVLATAALFGLPLEAAAQQTIVPPIDVPLPESGVVFITGPSGSGKSTLLRIIAQQSERSVIDVDGLPDLRERDDALVDVFDSAVGGAGNDGDGKDEDGEALSAIAGLLARVGLGDAFIMLRRPRELSDGQRMRLRMAQAMRAAEPLQPMQQSTHDAKHSCLIVMDEFCAALDRMTARTISRNLARWIRSTQHTLVVATAHDDLLEALQPDVLVYKGLGDAIDICTRGADRAFGV